MIIDEYRKEILNYCNSRLEFGYRELVEFSLLKKGIIDHIYIELIRIDEYSEKINLHLTEESQVKQEEVIYQLAKIESILSELIDNGYIDSTISQIPKAKTGEPIISFGSKSQAKSEITTLTETNLEFPLYSSSKNIFKKTTLLSNFIENDFKTAEEIKFQETLEIARTNATNSSRIFAANILSLILSLLAIGSSIYFNQVSQNSNKRTIDSLTGIEEGTGKLNENLNSVNTKFAEVPKRIDEFSKSISGLNKTLSKQQDEILNSTERLEKTMTGFNNSVDNFKSSMLLYNNQLEEIIQQTETQLKIWKDQQSILKDEFERKPEISYNFSTCEDKDSLYHIEGIQMLNTGNIMAEVQAVSISVLSKDFISCEGNKYKITKKENTTTIYVSKSNFKSGEFELYPNFPRQIVLNLKLKTITRNPTVRLTYASKYEDRLLKQVLQLNCK